MKDQHMKKQLFATLALAGLFALAPGRSAAQNPGQSGTLTITENFAVNPLQHGWRIFGETNLFTWDSTNLVEYVTWDSSQPDSFLYLPLGTVLTMDNDFSLSFELQVFDAVGANYSNQLAVDLFNFADATNANYSRTDYYLPPLPNIFEFDYYPGTTESPYSVTGTLFDMNGTFFDVYDDQVLNPGVTYTVILTHTAGVEGLSGQVLVDGQPFSTLPSSYADGELSNFQLDTISISCFQDDGFGDSVLAHGSVGNIVVTVLPLPVEQLTGAFTNGQWAATFLCRSDWRYSLERSPDLQNWTIINPDNAGNGTNLVLYDPYPPATNAFYRILAERP